ncbi:TetR/AcrR family transcriptional regulator [Microlunatus soli]|uniref:DNA-binding transcriptional regulator, AcrR family n=1 Tax=Microlunatus soli TaxID=630515 RepID=A0A1H1SU18_9ACTN|nr:TetR/AcrR family transcriptional regulator [Microlunatus soli]SDS51425.1 DNA-binding transcriptional regulator, AcrR family [Microlunatus soli]
MAGPTPRQLAREETLRRIKTLALQQLAESGAGELSLRAIARELNLVSSAIYRYFASRDELITALITDAYNDLADVLEEATGPRRSPQRRWRDVCGALRDWAREEPHRYGLIYGTSIPGYRAPQTTVEPAVRVYSAFCRSVADWVDGQPEVHGRALRGQLAQTADALALEIDEPVMLALLAAFGRIIGTIGLELGGHFVGAFEPADDLYEAVVEREAGQLGLTD